MQTAILDLDELTDFAKLCAKTLHGGEIIALIGDLGAGKTTFTKALLKAVGIKKRVTSPTFGIIAAYQITRQHRRHEFFHVDLYRIHNLAEFKALGIAQTWQQPDTTYIIEWADKVSRALPKGTTLIRFTPTKDGKRKLSISTK
jgi:tRNA threonylcarbamoyladenosine biosynthesis protein TsaE